VERQRTGGSKAKKLIVKNEKSVMSKIGGPIGRVNRGSQGKKGILKKAATQAENPAMKGHRA